MSPASTVVKRRTVHNDCGRICIAFVSSCVVGKNPKDPNLSPMADDAITRGNVGGLGIAGYIYGYSLGEVSISSGVNTDINLTTIYQVGACVVHWNNIAGLWITKLWVWALLRGHVLCPWARHLVLIASLT